MMVTVASKRKYTPLGDALRYLRKRAGLSQSQLADSAGMDRSYISMLENGQRTNISHEYATALARGLGISMEDLYKATGSGWIGEPPPPALPVNDPSKLPILRRLADLPVEGLLQLERIWRVIHLESTPRQNVGEDVRPHQRSDEIPSDDQPPAKA